MTMFSRCGDIPAASTHRRCRYRRCACLAACAVFVAALLWPHAASAADISPPTEPGAITVTGVTGNTVALHWIGSTDNVGIEGYRVYRGPPAAAESALSLIATTDAVTSYTATRLYSGTGYKFGDRGDRRGEQQVAPCGRSRHHRRQHGRKRAARPPSSTSVSRKAFSSSRIDLVVGGVAPPATSPVTRCFRDGAHGARVDLPNGLRYSDNGLAASSSHVYAIRAVDSAGNISAATTAERRRRWPHGAVLIARGPVPVERHRRPRRSSRGGRTCRRPAWSASTTSTAHGHRPGRHACSTTWSRHRPEPGHAATCTRSRAARRRPASGALRDSSAARADVQLRRDRRLRRREPGRGAERGQHRGRRARAFIQTLGDNIYPSAGLPDPNFTTTYSDFDARFFKPFGSGREEPGVLPGQRQQGVLRRRGVLGRLPDAGQQPQLVQLQLGRRAHPRDRQRAARTLPAPRSTTSCRPTSRAPSRPDGESWPISAPVQLDVGQLEFRARRSSISFRCSASTTWTWCCRATATTTNEATCSRAAPSFLPAAQERPTS